MNSLAGVLPVIDRKPGAAFPESRGFSCRPGNGLGIEFHKLSFFLPTTTVQETYTFLLAAGSHSS